ncbi:MAG: hypothetical protein ABIH90_01220 [Candidatus Aenigmatarchaeota archaeon]
MIHFRKSRRRLTDYDSMHAAHIRALSALPHSHKVISYGEATELIGPDACALIAELDDERLVNRYRRRDKPDDLVGVTTRGLEALKRYGHKLD